MADFRDKYWFEDIDEIFTLKDLICKSEKKFSENPAFWVKAKKGAPYKAINYSLLKHDVEALGLRLREMGLSDARIGVMGMGSYEWIVTYLAVVTSGGIIVPIDKELSSDEVLNLMNTAECRVIFYTSSEASKINKIDADILRVKMEFYGDRTDIDIAMKEHLAASAAEENGAKDANDKADFLWKNLIAEGEEIINRGIDDFYEGEDDPERMSALLFTSGTTGVPKGVMLCQKNIMYDIMDTCRIANIHEDDKTLSILPIHHTYECTFGMLLVLYRGASTAFCEGLKYITTNMKEAHNTAIVAVPLVLEMIYSKIWKAVKKQGKEKILKNAIKLNNKFKCIGIDMSRKLFRQVHDELGGKLRFVISGAAAIDPNVLRGFEDFGITVLQGYGLTECTPLVAGTPQKARERYRKAGSVGVAVKHGTIEVVNKDEDGIGEIRFRGPNLMMGYYNMPEETSKVMKDGWFYTGDLGFVDKDGWLYLTGRQKNVIVTKTGKNIYPEEIEEVINRIPAVVECMVYGELRGNEDIVAVQILPDMEELTEILGHKPDGDEVYRYFKSQVNEANMKMTSYKRVKDVIVRNEDFVRTTTRKIRRKDNIPAAENTK